MKLENSREKDLFLKLSLKVRDRYNLSKEYFRIATNFKSNNGGYKTVGLLAYDD